MDVDFMTDMCRVLDRIAKSLESIDKQIDIDWFGGITDTVERFNETAQAMDEKIEEISKTLAGISGTLEHLVSVHQE